MNLIEVLVAGSVFAMASGSSVQIWAAGASSARLGEDSQQVLERTELDLLRLKASWRQAADQGAARADCGLAVVQMQERAQAIQPPPRLERRVVPSADGAGIEVHYRSATPHLERARLFTPAALGLCPAQEVAE